MRWNWTTIRSHDHWLICWHIWSTLQFHIILLSISMKFQGHPGVIQASKNTIPRILLEMLVNFYLESALKTTIFKTLATPKMQKTVLRKTQCLELHPHLQQKRHDIYSDAAFKPLSVHRCCQVMMKCLQRIQMMSVI